MTAVSPLVAFAQPNLGAVQDVLNSIIPLLILLATVIFLWNLVRWIVNAGDAEKRKEATQGIIWGIIFLAVMVAVWGFVDIVLDFVFGGSVDTSDFKIPIGPSQ